VTVDEITAAIDFIDRAIASNVVIGEMEFAEQKWVLRTIDQMIRAREFLAGLLATASGTSASNYRLAATSKGT
jgi:hypothetical protein